MKSEPYGRAPLPTPGQRIVRAQYWDPLVPDYRGNPLIEALPPILTKSEAVALLGALPQDSDKERKLPPEIRLHLIRRAARFFAPLPRHFELQERISAMIREAYLGRNPTLPGYYAHSRRAVGRLITVVGDEPITVKQAGRQGPGQRSPQPQGELADNFAVQETLDEQLSTAHGFSFVGVSGVGKTSSLRRVLALYPQLIIHKWYKDKPLLFKQVVWLMIECPHDGQLGGLCEQFFLELDKLLGTQYSKLFVVGRRLPQRDLMRAMANLAIWHGIGGLFIDEIQKLSEARSGGRYQVLNFFTELINTVGMPVVLVGTPKALPILSGEFRVARRGCGQGDLVWDRLQEDKQWHEFLEVLWPCQYTRIETGTGLDWEQRGANGRKLPPEPTPVTHALYEETQGIIDLALGVYRLAQARAISTGIEKVTADIIVSVARDSLRTVQPVLAALRQKDQHALAQIGDVYINFDSFLARTA